MSNTNNNELRLDTHSPKVSDDDTPLNMGMASTIPNTDSVRAQTQLSLFDFETGAAKRQPKTSQPMEQGWGNRKLFYSDTLAQAYPQVFRPGWNLSKKKKKLAGAALDARIRRLAKSAGIPVIEVPKSAQTNLVVAGKAIYFYR